MAAKKSEPATVDLFLRVLTSKLTQQDMKEMAREMKHGRGNPYRLGLLFEAAQKVEDDVKPYLGGSDLVAMTALKASLARNFTSNFPPLKNVTKQIDAYLTAGKRPSPAAKFLQEMQAMLSAKGYAPAFATTLQDEGMGPEELAERLKDTAQFEFNYNVPKKPAPKELRKGKSR